MSRGAVSKSSAASKARAEALARGVMPGAPADRRALERDMIRATRELIAREGIDVIQGPRDPALERAQELVYDAWETEGEKRLALAIEALEQSADCADAYVILAEAASSLGQALEAYALGMRAGERALGPEVFDEEAGHFWGVAETRGYMRARAGLAQSLWLLGEHEAALAHYRAMLRLNPNDNQGVRYFLLDALFVLGFDDEAETLLRRSEYSDDASCEWVYGNVLLEFRRQGDSTHARAALVDARKRNPHVAPFLIGTRELPEELPELLQIGGETEAISYVAERAEGWTTTDGAIDWIRSQTH